MFKRLSKKRKIAILNIALSTLVIGSIGVSTFAYWSAPEASTNAIFSTNKYNATDDEFDYYAAIPNVFATDGYDYYNLNTIPNDLVCRVTGLAVVRYEALTSTSYIPSYPKVTVGGTKFNDGTNQLPVIHILSGMSSNDTAISNGYSKIESLIIPSTVTYIQQGAFNGCTKIKDVSILCDSKSGYLNYTSGEFGSITPVFERPNSGKTNRNETNYTISTTNDNLVTQFSDKRLEYDNLTNKYYTYVVNKSTSDITVTVDSKTATITAGAKYKLEYDKTELTASAYSYKLTYDSKEVPLTLNAGQVGYEEYKLDSNYSVFSTSNYQTVAVNEYIGGKLNKASRATFNLKCLDANYSQDNDNFEFKYAPNNIFESIHYYNTNGNDDLKSIKVQKRIGVEKAYFLNNVTSDVQLINGDKIMTISVPYEDAYKNGLYVKAQYGSISSDYYADPKTGEKTIPMKLENGVFTYSFAQSVIDSAFSQDDKPIVSELKMTFYGGKEEVTYPDNYVGTAAAAATLNEGYRRVYFNPYATGSLNLSSDYNVTTDEYRYHWYVVGWDSEGHETSYKMAFLDNQRKAWIVDVPTSVERFKLARMEGEKPLDTSNNWSHITNISRSIIANHSNANGDYLFTSSEKYTYLDFERWNPDNKQDFYIKTSTTDSNLVNSVAFKNDSHLILSNCKGSTKYVPLKENIFYGYKNIASSMYEFSTYDEDNVIASIPVPAGTSISAKANNVSCGYDLNNISIGFAGSSEKITGAELSKYIKQSANGIEFISDCMIVPYIKTTGSSGYNWYIEIHSSELEGITSESVVDTSNVLGITPAIKTTTVGNTGSVNSPDFVPGELMFIYLNDINNRKGSNHFFAYFWNSTTDDKAWQKLIDSKNNSGQYMCEITSSVTSINPTNVIFVLKSNTTSGWETGVVSQTKDIPFSLKQTATCIDYKYLPSTAYVRGNQTNCDWNSNKDEWKLYLDDENQYVISHYFTTGDWKLYNNGEWYGRDKVDKNCESLVNGTDNISFKTAGEYTVYLKQNGTIWINEGNTTSLNWYEPFTLDVISGGVTQTISLKRGANTMEGNAMQFYGTGINLKVGANLSELQFKFNGIKFDVGTDDNPRNLVKLSSGKLVTNSNVEVSDVTVFLKSYGDGGFNSWFQDAKSPVLKVNGSPELLIRNHANTAFEEFISFKTAKDSYYVVSPYYEYNSSIYFGNGSSLHYYGDEATSENKLGSYHISEANRLFTFKPNSINGTEEYIIVKDNNGRYLGTLNYSESESLSRGIHTFDGLFSYVKDEYTNIKLYYKNGDTETLVYGGASEELKPEFLSQTLSSQKTVYQYDYYMDSVNPNKAFVMDNGSYYMDAVTFSTRGTTHQIVNKNGVALTIVDSIYGYGKIELNGYKLFTHIEGDSKRFAVSDAGCYDILVYLIDDNSCYVGHRSATANTNVFKLRILDNNGNTVTEYNMNQTENNSLYLYDAFIKAGYKAQVVNNDGVALNNIAFNSSNCNKYNRIMYSHRTNEITYVSIDTIAIHFTPGGLNKYRPIYDTSEIVYRYNPDPFRLRLDDTAYSAINPTSSKGSLIQNVNYDPTSKTYCWDFISNSADDVITISGTTYTIKEAGNYKLTYSNGTIRATRLQKPDTYYISLDNNIIAELNVKLNKKEATSVDYYEYIIDNVKFHEDVDLAVNDLNVVDANGYLVCEINKVTIVGQTTSSTEIKKGAYTLTYSVDSARRTDSAYFVFTYFRLTKKAEGSTAIVTFKNLPGITVDKTQVVDTSGSNLLPASTLFTLEPGTEFLGWSTSSSSSTIAYTDQQIVSTTLTLYPVIGNVYKAEILTDLTFDSLNPEVLVAISGAKTITSVKHSNTEYLGTSYITVSNNLITIQNELFEKIGSVGSQTFTVTFTDLNGIEGCTVEFTIEYPNFGEAV